MNPCILFWNLKNSSILHIPFVCMEDNVSKVCNYESLEGIMPCIKSEVSR